MKSLRIYRLVPAADRSDPRWDLAPFQGEVTVRAISPADARLVATDAEVDFPEAGAKPGDGVKTDFASAFRDDKLYHVVEDHSGEFPEDGERSVVAGDPSRDVITAIGRRSKAGSSC
jgi:hypothetical protein